MSVLPLDPVTINLLVLTIILPPTLTLDVVVIVEILPVVPLNVAAETVPSAVILPVAPNNVIVCAWSGPTNISSPKNESSNTVIPPLGTMIAALPARRVAVVFALAVTLPLSREVVPTDNDSSTVAVPPITVLPLSESTVNWSTLELFCTLNALLSALRIKLSWNTA